MLFDRDGVDVVTTSTARQMVMIKDPGSNERYCRGPDPDSSLTSSGGVTLSLPSSTGSKSVGAQKQEDALSFGGRSPAVLITRELMYRACELSMNINADADKTIAIYQEFVRSIERIVASQRQQGAAPLASTKSSEGGSGGDSSDDASDSSDSDADKDGSDKSPKDGSDKSPKKKDK
ncbi:MAG TPA: hypothetical protein VFV55_06405 [Usitatibacteraceae bacterium]|nr:hypothetical protein [Usitatibacteraceae bacterium]